MTNVSTAGVFSIGTRPLSPSYSIGTLVTDRRQHAEMRASLLAGGFSEADCEFLVIDNSGVVQTDAYRGLNALLNAAAAPIVILCHQDIRLLQDGRADLDARLQDLNTHDPMWAVAGNAGGVAPGVLAMRITDPHSRDRTVGALPASVQSLDENLLIVRRDCRIGFSVDLSGYHFYGSDICLHAKNSGYSAYVIDFHLEHLSPGRKGADFALAEAAFRTKWSRAIAPRWLQTTCSLIRLSSGPVNWSKSGTISDRLARTFERSVAKALRRMPRARESTKVRAVQR